MMRYIVLSLALLIPSSVKADWVAPTGVGANTVVYQGSAWDDSMSPALSISGAADAPDDCTILGDATMGPFKCFNGTGVTVEDAVFELQIPHSYKVGTTLKPHIHWMPTTTDAGDVVWQVEYSVSEIGGTFGATNTVACTTTAAGGTAWVHKISGCPDIADATLGISSILVGRIFRDPAAGADTYAADVAYLGFDIHFEQDTPGSRDAVSK